MSAERLNPYAFNFATINSCDKQSNAFDRPVNSTPNAFLLSIGDFHFRNIASRQFCALKPLRKLPHWYFVICQLVIFSKIFELIGKILTGR